MIADPYLSDLMKIYRFSIANMESLGSGSAVWGGGARIPGGPRFDAVGRWREVRLEVRRDILCEVCGRDFGYAFRIVAGGTVQRGQKTIDPVMVTPRLERELRRRVRCPHCRAVQRDVRRIFVRREARHTLVGVTALGGTVLGSIALSSGGYLVAGSAGLVAGLGLSFLFVLRLTLWMLGELIDPVPLDPRRHR
jgi:hypothetical protein